MTGRENGPAVTAALRKRAEEMVRERESRSPAMLEGLSPVETRQTLHELRVHQIELAMQNEELRRAQVELEASRARYFDLYDLAPMGYCTLSEKGVILEANLTAATMLGVARGGLVRQPLTRFILSEDQDIYYLNFKRLSETGEPQVCEFRLLRTNADPIWVRMDATAAGEAGEAPVYRAVLSDIGKRKRAEEELRKSREELERSNRELLDFAFIATHDLQEPLRKVVTFGGLLREGCKQALGETGEGYLRRMVGAAERMQALLDSLLEYSRVSTRAAPFTKVDLGILVDEVLSDLELAIRENGGEVQVGDLGVVKADPSQMRQVFQNLIGNAVKFRRKGVRPLIKVSRTVDMESDTVQVLVEDNGIGFDQKYLARMFKPFQRLHGRTSPYEGTGMGLAICKKVVERHGGTITARSTPGVGSTFILRLPIKQQCRADGRGQRTRQAEAP